MTICNLVLRPFGGQNEGNYMLFGEKYTTFCLNMPELKKPRNPYNHEASVERGRQDLNPRHSVLETDVLPLNYYPIGTNSTLFP